MFDPLKVPAFQRKKGLKKMKKIKTGIPINSKYRIGLLKKENILAKRKNKILESRISLTPRKTKKKSNLLPISIAPSWRKMKTIGAVTHYFEKIDVIAFKLEQLLRIGDHILVESKDGLFEQEVTSMQIEREEVKQTKKGSEVGLKVKFSPVLNGMIYKVVAEGG